MSFCTGHLVIALKELGLWIKKMTSWRLCASIPGKNHFLNLRSLSFSAYLFRSAFLFLKIHECMRFLCNRRVSEIRNNCCFSYLAVTFSNEVCFLQLSTVHFKPTCIGPLRLAGEWSRNWVTVRSSLKLRELCKKVTAVSFDGDDLARWVTLFDGEGRNINKMFIDLIKESPNSRNKKWFWGGSRTKIVFLSGSRETKKSFYYCLLIVYWDMSFTGLCCCKDSVWVDWKCLAWLFRQC